MGKQIPELCEAFTTTASSDIKSYPPTACTFEIMHTVDMATGSILQLDRLHVLSAMPTYRQSQSTHTHLSIKEEVSREPDCGVATASIALW